MEAKNIFNQAREKALKDISAKKDVLDKQIDDEIGKAEQEIKELQKSAPDKINKIAIETSSELIQKLIGAEVNNSSISAIVDDLSRRSGDKYYGN
jgi:F-type H+-transporting ATPase subunit b